MNETITNLLNHRSIRKFKEIGVSESIVEILIQVAQHTASSSFMQAYSIIRVTDLEIRHKIAKIGKQHYIAEAPLLFVMVSDMNRNTMIAQTQGVDVTNLDSFDRFFSSATDAILAAQNMMVAAESLGLGGVFLGSILNDVQSLNQLLKLPQHVVPVLGIALGYPDQSPQLKPRLPKELVYMENQYVQPNLDNMKKYDQDVHEYYDLRDANQRVDAFSTQVARYVQRNGPGRKKLLDFFREQGIIKY